MNDTTVILIISNVIAYLFGVYIGWKAFDSRMSITASRRPRK